MEIKNHDMTKPRRLISYPEVRELVGFTRQYLGRLERQGRFPRRIRLGENRVAWDEAEIAAWIERRAAAREGAA